MARRISVGGEDFVALRQSDSYYVDKTELLYELRSDAFYTSPTLWKDAHTEYDGELFQCFS